MGLLGYGYQQEDPLAGMDYMQGPQMRFSQMQAPGLMQPPQKQQGSGGGGLLSGAGGLLGGGGGGGSTLMSLFGGGSGGANVGDMARNWMGGMMNPNDPYGLNGKNAAAGLTQPELSGADMTNLVGGGYQMPQMQAPPVMPLPQKTGSSDFGGLLKLFLA